MQISLFPFRIHMMRWKMYQNLEKKDIPQIRARKVWKNIKPDKNK